MAQKMASIRGEITSNKADQNFKKFVDFMTDKIVKNTYKACGGMYILENDHKGNVMVGTTNEPIRGFAPFFGNYKCKKGDILYPATDSQPAIIATKDRNGYDQPWTDNDYLEVAGVQPALQPIMIKIMSGAIND